MARLIAARLANKAYSRRHLRLVLWRLTTNQLDYMKIIKTGTIPPADRPWWTKQIIACGYCTAQFQLDEGDNPAHGGERHPAGEHWVQCFCPTCKKSITARRQVMRGTSPENNRILQSHEIPKEDH